MRGLLDVSVLIAAFDSGHVHHARVMRWWSANAALGWASCPLTENGYLRIVSQRSYPRAVSMPDAARALGRQIAEGGHEFWPDDLSILEASRFDHGHLLRPRAITDVYLLALAVKHGGRLVTLDRGISLKAVKGAEPKHLASL